MREVGIRALKQNASVVVAEVAAGTSVTITDRGRPVARLTPLPVSRISELVESGRIRRRNGSLAELPRPEPGAAISEVLAAMRDEERY